MTPWKPASSLPLASTLQGMAPKELSFDVKELGFTPGTAWHLLVFTQTSIVDSNSDNQSGNA